MGFDIFPPKLMGMAANSGSRGLGCQFNPEHAQRIFGDAPENSGMENLAAAKSI
jgi:hypothetical protein